MNELESSHRVILACSTSQHLFTNYSIDRLPNRTTLPKRALFLLPLYAYPVVCGLKVMELRSWPNPFAEGEEFGILESGNVMGLNP